MEAVVVKLKKRLGNNLVAVLGSVTLAISGLLSVYSIGVGLHFVSALISGASFSIAVLSGIILLKTFVTATTLKFGGSGGLFFPTIVIGAGLGYIFSLIFNVNLAVMFIAVGMASLLAGTHKVLLTSVAFIVETLGGVFAIPALLASGVSYLLSGKNSFYHVQPQTKLKTEELALQRFFEKGKKLIPQKLEQTLAAEFMTKNPIVLHKGLTIKDALVTFERTKLRTIPLVDDENHVIGVVNLENVGYIDVRRKDSLLSESVMAPPVLVKESNTLEEIADLMMDTQEDHIFVTDEKEKIIGVISGIDVVKKIVELLSA